MGKRSLLVLGVALMAASALTRPADAAVLSSGSSWLSYHNGSAHSGYSSAIPSVGSLSIAWHRSLDGAVQASPLALGGLVFAATENDSVYALSRRTGATVWAHHLGTPVRQSALPCGNIDPLGITGTPAIDPATGRLFLVTTTVYGSSIRHTLWAFSAGTGKVLSKVAIDAPGQDPLVENQRGALTVVKGRVFVPFGGHAGDCGSYHGWLNSMTTSGTTVRYFRTGADREAGMWQPSGASVDASGYLYPVTGNGSRTSGSWDGGNAVFKINPTTNTRVSFFAPADWATGNANDTDLGSAGAALIGPYVYAQGKSSTGYLLKGQPRGHRAPPADAAARLRRAVRRLGGARDQPVPAVHRRHPAAGAGQ